MLIKEANPFRHQLAVTHKQLQVIKLREYIYNYLCKLESLSEKEACVIASNSGEKRLTANQYFTENDIKYVNGRLEEIEKLNLEIKTMLVVEN